ncbi:protein TolB [Candidatus Dependentiae bacterium Noda2021]|nr:protein TolB [Candidatus Dependentiae bacterium Noda2021]
MRKLWYVIVIAVNVLHAAEKNIELSVAAQHHQAMKIMVYALNSDEKPIGEIANLIQKDLEFTGQFKLTIKQGDSLPKKSDVVSWWHEGYPFVIFLQHESDSYQWRLYETSQLSMIKGKKHETALSVRAQAHAIADVIWNELTGKKGFFSTKIAYCKETMYKKKPIKHIYIADYDGSHEQCLVDSHTLNVAPRWNNDTDKPMLFYSEATNTNIRLASLDFNGNKKIASNFDGCNMLPSFSCDGKAVIYSASRGSGTCQLYYFKKGYFKRLTYNTGNNVSPVFVDDNTIVYCSDFEKGRPFLYQYHLDTKENELLVEGYCCTPSYCPQTKKIAYAKMVKGTLQLFEYDTITKMHQQLTFDAANKEECCWSPCGTYLLFGHDSGASSRIALLNTITKQVTFITSAKDKCSYPAWSGIYNTLPEVKS